MDRAFRARIGSQLLLEMTDSGRCRIKPDVLLKRGEMHQVFAEHEGGNPVFDCFLSIGDGAPDSLAELLQNSLYGWWITLDVFVNSLRHCGVGFHLALSGCAARWHWYAAQSHCGAAQGGHHRAVCQSKTVIASTSFHLSPTLTFGVIRPSYCSIR